MSACTVQKNILYLFRIVLKWRIQIKSILPAQCIQNCVGKAALIRTGLPSHYGDSSLCNTQGLIWNHQIRIKFHLISKSQTLWACTKRIVKGKASRLNFINADSAVRAGKALAEIHIIPIHGIHNCQSICQIQHGLKRIGKSLLDSRLHNQTVYNNGNVVLNILIQSDLLGKLIHIPINLCPYIAAASSLIQKLGMGSLASADYRGKKLDLGALRQLHDLIHHLVYRLLGNYLPALRAVWNSHAGI